MSKTNREWHEQNRMSKNATPQQRAEWHLEHAKHCACRPIPAGVLAFIKATGIQGDPERE